MGLVSFSDPVSIWEGPSDQWPVEHCQVLYIVSLYAQQAENVQSKESWIRQIALLVLLYEGIESNVLQFDYSPYLTWISYQQQTERRWLRISQEAKSVVDDLWESGLLNGIKLSSVDYLPVTAYQISSKGQTILAKIPEQHKINADRFIYPPSPHPKQILRIKFDGEFFVLYSGTYEKVSGITESEDVSYVSSPYLPSCLRSTTGFRIEPTNNRMRATESAHGSSMMLKDSKKSLVLSEVRALVSEWMPFGANQIAALSERLGAMERCQGGLFSSKIDEHPTLTHFEVEPGLTQVKILDFDSITFINFEAEINYPEDDGIIQVENFGMHLHVSGALLYGVKIEAIMNRTEMDIPLNLLARLLVDVHQDSSGIIRDLLSRYQLSVLDMIFMGKADQRNKYNLIMSSGITPKLNACKYLDQNVRENELKQILGEIYAGYDITREDVLFLGRDGCMLAGPSAVKYESLLTIFSGLNSRELFIRNLFVRTFVLDTTLQHLRKLIHHYHQHPTTLQVVKETLSEAARNIILLVECLQYLLESVENLELPTIPQDGAGAKIFKALSLVERKTNLLIRCKDSIKLIERLRTQLDVLVTKYDSISRIQLTDVSRNFDLNIKHMLEALQIRDRVTVNLTLLRVFFTGTLAFELIDRLSGGTFNLSTPPWFLPIKSLVDLPLMLFILQLIWFGLVWIGMQMWMKHKTKRFEASIVVRATVDKRINIRALQTMIHKRSIQVHTEEYYRAYSERQTYIWTERDFPTPGAESQIEVLVDERQQLLRSIRLQVFCYLKDSKPMQKKYEKRSFTSESFQRFISTVGGASPPTSGLTDNEILDKFGEILKREGVLIDTKTKTPLARLGSIKFAPNALFAADRADVSTRRGKRRSVDAGRLQEDFF